MAKDYNGNIEDEPVMFTESSVLENVVTGETLKVIIGKIKKLFNPTTGHDHDGTNSKKIAASNVDGLADYFDASTGHDHDGTDSKKLVVANVTNAVADTGDTITGQLIVNPSTDVVPIIAKGKADITNNLFESKLSDDSINFAVGKDSGTFTIKLGTAPATAGATGTAGTIIIAADGIYLCTAANTWVKAALATWSQN